MKTYRPISCRTKWMLLVSVVLVGLVAITPWRVTAQQQSRKDQRASTEQRPVTEQRPAKTSDDKKKEAPRPATATPSQAQPPERSQPSGAEAEKGKPADPLLRRPVQIEFSNETNTFIVKGLQRDIEQVMAIVKALGQTNEKQRSPIHVEFLEGPDVVVVRGHQADVARVTGIIKELEKETQDAEPERKEAPAKPNESKLNLRKLEAEFRRLQIENIRLRRLLDEQHKHASAPNLRGIVVAVGEKDLIEVSIGHDDGLREGQQLEVFRENVYLGRVVIRKTTPDRSVAEVLKDHRMGPFKRGDRVVTRLK